MVSVHKVWGQKWFLHPWKPPKRVQTHQNWTRIEHFGITLRFHPFWTLKAYFDYFFHTMVPFFGQKWIPHPWKPPKRVQEHQNRMKNKENKENETSECRTLRSFWYTPLGSWLDLILSSSQRAVTLVKTQSTTNI